MSITSSSTQADVLAQYNDNLDWEGSAAKAVLALEAVRWLLINRPQSLSRNNRTINYSALENEKSKLEDYVSRNKSSIGRSSFTRGRMLT